MKKVIVSILIAAGFLWVGLRSRANLRPQQADKRPNVLFIVADDMNNWSLLKNYAQLKTPNLDKLMSQSLFFKNASCAAPVCVPSRASFFSGRAPYVTGAYMNNPRTYENNSLSTTEVLPECFKRNGYLTWGGGKIFHAPINDGREAKMFDNKVYKGGFGPFAKKEDWYGRGHWYSVKPWTGPDTDFPDVKSANALTEFLSSQHDRPFFAYYGLFRPHTPYTAPKRFTDMYEGVTFTPPPGFMEGDLDDVPILGRDQVDSLKQFRREGLTRQQIWMRLMKAYCANYSFADWNIGRVLDALDKSEYGKNTIVIFVSDNGFHNGTKNHWTKSTLWEQADNVPFLVRMPDKKAYLCSQTVNLLDIYPTLVEYCKLKAAHPLEGHSIVPILKNPSYKWIHPGFTCHGENYSSVRDEHYRYIRYPDGSEELYDQDKDPYEHINIAKRPNMQAVIKKLSASIPAKFAKSLGGKHDDGE